MNRPVSYARRNGAVARLNAGCMSPLRDDKRRGVAIGSQTGS
jgi:hypothetical protein